MMFIGEMCGEKYVVFKTPPSYTHVRMSVCFLCDGLFKFGGIPPCFQKVVVNNELLIKQTKNVTFRCIWKHLFFYDLTRYLLRNRLVLFLWQWDWFSFGYCSVESFLLILEMCRNASKTVVKELHCQFLSLLRCGHYLVDITARCGSLWNIVS